MTSKRKRLLATAYHEAGHVAALIEYGRSFTKVTVKPDGNTLGCVHGGKLSKKFVKLLNEATLSSNKYLIERTMIINYAGSIAEKRYTKRANHAGASEDYQKIAEYLVRVFGDDDLIRAFDKYIYKLTEAILFRENVWTYVGALANMLSETETMTYDECIDLFYTHHGQLISKH